MSKEDQPLSFQPVRAATLQDVADLAGVSRTTASSILNGSRSSTRTSAATRDRVRSAATELDYRPNAVARSLRHQSTHTIGFYNGFGYIDTRIPFLSALISGMHWECDRQGYDMLIHRSSNPDDKMAHFQSIINGKVDGVVMFTHLDDPVAQMLAERRFPAVAVADSHPRIASVTADDEGGSQALAEHVVGSGCRRILYRMPMITHIASNLRHSAFSQTAQKLGAEVRMVTAGDTEDRLSETEKALFSDPRSADAIVCWCDGSALEVYKFVNAAGLANRFAIVGFDGFDFPGLAVKLTSVRVPWDNVAGVAVETVKRLISGEPVPPLTVVPVSLVKGDTG
ncbi:MAG: LacI family DNA-binding transcriptional regulator [Capsulimonadaceae bacterium]